MYAALALALVLTYRSSGVINFATGTIALYTAYTYAQLRQGHLLILIPGLPGSITLPRTVELVPAVLISLTISAVLGALLYLLVFRNLRTAPPLARTGASLGLLVILQALIVNRVGDRPIAVEDIFPAERWTWGDIGMLSDRFYLALAVVVLTLLLTAVFRWTRFGLLTRAVAETQTGALVSGVSPERVALANWVLSAMVAGGAGHPHLADHTADPERLRPGRGAGTGGRSRRSVRGLGPDRDRGAGDRHDPVRGVVAGPRPLLVPRRRGSAELVPLIVILVALLVVGRGIRTRGGLVREKPSAGRHGPSCSWPPPSSAPSSGCPGAGGHPRNLAGRGHQLLHRRDHRPVADRGHRLRRSGLPRPAHAGRRRWPSRWRGSPRAGAFRSRSRRYWRR